jgi:hypothetical protein
MGMLMSESDLDHDRNETETKLADPRHVHLEIDEQ